MPNHELSREEREEMLAINVVAADGKDVDPSVWAPAHVVVIRAAAEDPQVERIFVNAAIKKALCRDAGSSRAWLYKVRPWWKHTYHFRVRIRCPADNADCDGQPEVSDGEGCGKELDWWFTEAALHPQGATAGSAEAADHDGRFAGRLPQSANRALVWRTTLAGAGVEVAPPLNTQDGDRH